MKKVLTIAGSDPSAGAGIQADLKTFQALDVYGLSAITALTVQNSRGVSATYPVSPDVLSCQLESLFSDMKPDAVKTGMLLTRENVTIVARTFQRSQIKHLVIDPVMNATSGRTLIRSSAISPLKKLLLPLAEVVTPNVPEAESLSGISIRTEADLERAAQKILHCGPGYVLMKGGHRRGPAVDILYGGERTRTFSTPRRRGTFHGTGCVLSSAIAVFIARGYAVEKAVEKAKQFVDSMLKTAMPVGKNKTMLYFQF